MPRRVRQLALPVWRDPEAVFRAFFAEAAYVVWLDGERMPHRDPACSRSRTVAPSS